MKTKAEVEQQLREVRAILEADRARGSKDTDMMYGAQQALGWVLGELKAPAEMEKFITALALVASR